MPAGWRTTSAGCCRKKASGRRSSSSARSLQHLVSRRLLALRGRCCGCADGAGSLARQGIKEKTPSVLHGWPIDALFGRPSPTPAAKRNDAVFDAKGLRPQDASQGPSCSSKAAFRIVDENQLATTAEPRTLSSSMLREIVDTPSWLYLRYPFLPGNRQPRKISGRPPN